MKKTITRGQAVVMHEVLSTMAFGCLKGDDLVKMVYNSDEVRKVSDEYKALVEELHKRLFDTKTEEYKKFAPKVDAAQRLDGMARIKAFAIIKEEFPEMYELLERQAKTDAKLREKEVSIELEEIDRKTFVQNITEGNPGVKIGAFDYLAPIFCEEPKELTELDELLND